MKKLYDYLVNNVVGFGSRGINVFIFFGHASATTSARSHVEYWLRGKWNKRRAFINALFFWQKDHCELDFAARVKRAHETLEIARQIDEIRRNR